MPNKIQGCVHMLLEENETGKGFLKKKHSCCCMFLNLCYTVHNIHPTNSPKPDHIYKLGLETLEELNCLILTS